MPGLSAAWVEDKNTVSDFDSEEQKRGISISTSLSTVPYKDKTFYILDTPGFADFVGEQRCAMRVSDGALVLVNATSGVEVQTHNVWEFAETFETPAISSSANLTENIPTLTTSWQIYRKTSRTRPCRSTCR